jgi:hypothetical protein
VQVKITNKLMGNSNNVKKIEPTRKEKMSIGYVVVSPATLEYAKQYAIGKNIIDTGTNSVFISKTSP